MSMGEGNRSGCSVQVAAGLKHRKNCLDALGAVRPELDAAKEHFRATRRDHDDFRKEGNVRFLPRSVICDELEAAEAGAQSAPYVLRGPRLTKIPRSLFLSRDILVAHYTMMLALPHQAAGNHFMMTSLMRDGTRSRSAVSVF
jgi:hypothetical protein